MSFLIAYVKITENKFDGLVLDGIYFGGVAKSVDRGEEIAKECANTIKGGTIIPKLFEIQNNDFVQALDAATAKFESIYDNMLQVNMSLSAPKKAKWQPNSGMELDTEAI